jgi:hypothetical protein
VLREWNSKFVTNNFPRYALHIGYDEKHTKESENAKSRGLQIDEHVSWKNRIDKMIPKSSEPCCTGQYFMPASLTLSKQLILRLFHCILKYGMIWWEVSVSDIKKVITL